MLSVEVFCSLALLTMSAWQVTFGYLKSTTPPPPPSCRPGLIIDCAQNFEKLIWSKDEKNKCRPIQNRCIYNQANCDRYRQKVPLLQEICKKKCQTLCVKDCSQATNVTICAHREGRNCTFPSQCEWSKHLCNTGEFWQQEGPVPCGENPKPCFP